MLPRCRHRLPHFPDLVESPADLRLNCGVERAGETYRQLWLGCMKEQHQFFPDDGTRARADLRVDDNPSITHDPETEIVRLGLSLPHRLRPWQQS